MNTQDVSALLTNIKAKNPDIVLGAGHLQDSLLIVKQAKDLGVSPKAMGFSVGPSSPEFRENLKSNADYLFGATQWTEALKYNGDDPWKTPKAYGDAFRAKNPKYTVIPYQVAESSAAVIAFWRAIEKANSLDPTKVRDAIAALDIMTFYGQIKFDSRGINIVQADGDRAAPAGRQEVHRLARERRREGRPLPDARLGQAEVSLGELGQIFVNAVLLSGILALVALGFSLVWGIMNIVNLAHGAFIVLGAYITFFLHELLHVDPFLSIPVAMLALFTLGWGIQRGLINQVIKAPLLATFLLTFGLELLIVNLINFFFKADLRSVTTPYSGTGLHARARARPVHPARRARRLARPRRGPRLVPEEHAHGPRDPRRPEWTSTPRASRASRSRRSTRSTFAIGAGMAGAAGLAPLDDRAVRPEPRRRRTRSARSRSASSAASATSRTSSSAPRSTRSWTSSSARASPRCRAPSRSRSSSSS